MVSVMPFADQICIPVILWISAGYNKFMIKEICLPWTPSYLIQSLLNDQNRFYSQRHSAIKAVKSFLSPNKKLAAKAYSPSYALNN